jgi:ribonuclease-3
MASKTSSILQRGWSVFGKLVTGTRKGPAATRVRQLRQFEKRIGIRFTDILLLEQALTHRSYSHVTSRTRNASNERMEFLGDSVLGLAVSQFLYLRFPDRSEGALSKMKSLLVSRKILSSVSRDVGVGEYLLLSGEESEMGGRDRESILADSFEGIIGAIYLDQGYRAASTFIRRFLLAQINEFLKDEEHTNYKSLLQEHVQSKRLSHPVYRVHGEEGPEHEKEFLVDVVVRNEVWGTGRGKSKKDAEQAAARAALESRLGGGSGGGQDSSRPESGRSSRAAETRRPRGGRRRSSAKSAREAEAEQAPQAASAESEPPPRPAAKDGLHGVHASRDLLRAARREEEKQQEREEKSVRERRGLRRRRRRTERSAAPRDAEAPAPGEAPPPAAVARDSRAPRSEAGGDDSAPGSEAADEKPERGERSERFPRRRRRPAQRRGRR